MDFVGSWLRQLLKAGTAAALVPAAMAAALVVVIAGTGGLGGLGSLGQLVSGPQPSAAKRGEQSSPGGRTGPQIVAPPAILADRAAGGQPGAAPATTRAPEPGGTPPAAAPSPAPSPAPAPSPGPGVAPPPAGGPPAGTAPVGSPPAPSPPTVKDRTKGVVEDLGDVVDEVVVVLEKVTEGLGQTVDRILDGSLLRR